MTYRLLTLIVHVFLITMLINCAPEPQINELNTTEQGKVLGEDHLLPRLNSHTSNLEHIRDAAVENKLIDKCKSTLYQDFDGTLRYEAYLPRIGNVILTDRGDSYPDKSRYILTNDRDIAGRRYCNDYRLNLACHSVQPKHWGSDEYHRVQCTCKRKKLATGYYYWWDC